MLEYIFQRKLLFAFVAAVLLLGGLSFSVYGLSRCLDRERWQSEDKMLDSLRRLPNVAQVTADLEIYFCSRTDIHFIYVVHVRCKRGRGCTIARPGTLNQYIQRRIMAGSGEGFDGVRLEVGSYYKMFYQPLYSTKIN